MGYKMMGLDGVSLIRIRQTCEKGRPQQSIDRGGAGKKHDDGVSYQDKAFFFNFFSYDIALFGSNACAHTYIYSREERN